MAASGSITLMWCVYVWQVDAAILKLHSRRVCCLAVPASSDSHVLSGDKKGGIAVWNFMQVRAKPTRFRAGLCIRGGSKDVGFRVWSTMKRLWSASTPWRAVSVGCAMCCLCACIVRIHVRHAYVEFDRNVAPPSLPVTPTLSTQVHDRTLYSNIYRAKNG
jgi:hypothetical protein